MRTLLWIGLFLLVGGYVLAPHSMPGPARAPKLPRGIRAALHLPRPVVRAQGMTPARAVAVAAMHTTPTLYSFTLRATLPPPPFPKDNPLTNEGVALGERLFFEKDLSRDSTISCAKCHDPGAAFSDPGKAVSHGVDRREGRRNTQALFNLAWRQDFFWDGRAKTLREQVLHPIQDPLEMDFDPGDAVERLAADPSYALAFQRAFGKAPSVETMALALEQFLLVQISQDAKVDRFAQGEPVLTAQERRGMELFFAEYDPARGKLGADCFHCHGNALLTNERYANNGLDERGKDPGRYEVTRKEHDRGRFKVPSLRNVAVTAPYMHDGRFRTLEEVVEHYASGVKPSLTLDPNLSKHNGNLQLTASDKAALVAFLRALTDEPFLERGRALAAKHGGDDHRRGGKKGDQPPPPPPPPAPPRRASD